MTREEELLATPDELAAQWSGLPARIIRRNFNWLPPHLVADAHAEGAMALYEVSRRFDKSRGNRFSTYAYWWVRGRLLSWANAEMRELGFSDNPKSRAELPDDAPWEGGVDHRTQAVESVADLDFAQSAAKVLHCLTPRERSAVQMRIGMGIEAMTLAEIGVVLNVTKERVRQILIRSMEKVRRHHGASHPDRLYGRAG